MGGWGDGDSVRCEVESMFFECFFDVWELFADPVGVFVGDVEVD